MVEMKVQGLVFDSETNQSIVILKEEATGRTLPIWVGIFEANAINMGIEHTWTPRPMTHDLLKNIIEGLQASVRKIMVTELKSNTFYATVLLESEGRLIEVDSRPATPSPWRFAPRRRFLWPKKCWNPPDTRTRSRKRKNRTNGSTTSLTNSSRKISNRKCNPSSRAISRIDPRHPAGEKGPDAQIQTRPF